MDFGCACRIQQFPPQVVNVDWNRIGLQFVIDPIEPLLEQRLGHHPTNTPHQVLQDRGLTPGQKHRDRANPHVSTDRIEADIASREHGAKRPPGGVARPLCAQ